MNGVAFDTHKFITDMTNAGMKPEMAEALSVYFHALPQGVATKHDLAELKADIFSRVNNVSIGLAALVLTSNGIIIGLLISRIM